jgi:deoxyribodipyrimidine photo-lyase
VTATLLWFRRDLRLQDHPALNAALARGGPVIPVYVGATAGGAAGRWWLHHSLAALDRALQGRGGRLVRRRGAPERVLPELVRASGATAVYWSVEHEPAQTTRDSTVRAALATLGVETRGFDASLLHDPATVSNRQGRPFQVFSAFWRHCLTRPVAPPVKTPGGPWPAPARWPDSVDLTELQLLPAVRWDSGFAALWEPGEEGAQHRLERFIRRLLDDYAAGRDRPADAATSRLSAALHWGEITPRQIWAAVKARSRGTGVFPPSAGAKVFLAELGWREFAHHLLYHFPRTVTEPLRAEFARFPWAEDRGGGKLRVWQRGRTGYPIVDAGMRELWTTGWMHNRVRMIVASFLTKHLRLPWTLGAGWFADTLVDADVANNTLGWQWTAGCGADAAPYFRIFAPVLQGRKFDPAGEYVRRWVPELAALPAKFIHAPWEAPDAVLAEAGVRLGATYPRPIVDHAAARAEALQAFQDFRTRRSP